MPDQGKQLIATFFKLVFQILEVEDLFTTTYFPHRDGQSERFNCTIHQALCNCVAHHSKNCDLCTDILTYAHSTRVHSAPKPAPFKFVLSRVCQPLEMALRPVDGSFISATHSILRWRHSLQYLLGKSGKQLCKAQNKYRGDYNKHIWIPVQRTGRGSLVFTCKKYYGTEERRHKLAQIPDKP